MDYYDVVEIAAEEMLNSHLGDEKIPILYVLDETSIADHLITFVGIHLLDTVELLSYSSKKFISSHAFDLTVKGTKYTVCTRSYEVWGLLATAGSCLSFSGEDILKLAHLPAVHHNDTFRWLTDDKIHDLISKCLFQYYLKTCPCISRIVRFISYLSTQSYIWEPQEIEKFAAQISLPLGDFKTQEDFDRAHNALEKAIKTSTLPDNVSPETIQEIDSKVRQIRATLI